MVLGDKFSVVRLVSIYKNPFNHLLINEAGGWTLENINGNGRLKAELRKNSQSCKRIIFYVKVRI